DLVNPEGHRVVPDVSKPLPLGGPPVSQILHANSQCYQSQEYERYGYTYLKEIVLRRADYKEYKISKADFKNLHPNDFEDIYLLHLQGHLNHLSQSFQISFAELLPNLSAIPFDEETHITRLSK
nr:hypothetical protein CTI12_AA475510 [Tanacetum cinerariifolium]